MTQEQPNWRLWIDCVRPGHRDEDLEVDVSELPPAAEQALERSEQWDQRVQEALKKTEVPLDLAARLEAQLDQRLESTMGPPLETRPRATEESSQPGASIRDRSPRRFLAQRRWWITAAAVLLVCSLLPWMGGPRKLPGSQVVQQASEWAEQWQREDEQFDWVRKLPPSHHPLAATIDMPLDSLAWRTAELLGDNQAVVYQSGATTLAVIQASHVTQLGAVPPKEPQFQTGRRRISAWAHDGLVFVLIVDGDLARYQSVLRRPFDA